MLQRKLLLATALLLNSICNAQSIGIGTATPNSSAQLDVASTTKGLLAPRMTFVQRNAITTPAAGLLIYQTDLVSGFYYYNGSAWTQLNTGSTANYWSLTGSNIFSNNAGNVGIGAATPLEKMHVKGITRIDPAGATGNAVIKMHGATTNDQSFIYFYNSLAAGTPAATFGYSAPSDYLLLSNGSTTAYLKSEGLGISTNAPLTKLHIDGGQDAGFGVNKNGYAMLGLANSSNLVIDANEILARNNGRKTDLFLQNDSGNVILCTNGEGVVGVGGSMGFSTTSPYTKLHILGGQDAGMNNTTGNGYMMMGSGTGANLVIDNNEIIARNNTVASGSGADLFLQHDAGNVILCGNEQGGVGIGITAGTSIPLGYLLAVDGKIISEELKVQLSGNWPDYVFDKKYKLPSFNELRNYIAVNKHLPNIPAAAEVEKNGIEVGDMQKRMMEKIEELTLYILELEKKITTLETKQSAAKQ